MRFKFKNNIFEVKNSNRKGKQKVAIFTDGNKVHFGDKEMKEYPGTKRGDAYCSRSFGIGKRDKTLNNIQNANTLSRIILWKCKGKKSMKTFEEAGINKI